MSDSNYHNKTDSQLVRKLNFEDEDSPVTVEQPEPISIDGNDKIHSNIEEEVILKLGIKWDWARCVCHKGDKDGSRKWLDRVFCCYSESILGNDKKDDNVKCHHLETRCGCLVEMKISCRCNEKYCVVKFVWKHTRLSSSL